MSKWLVYCLVYAMFEFVEPYCRHVPFYSLSKTAFLIGLFLPEITLIEQQLQKLSVYAQKELVLLWPDSIKCPCGKTNDWLTVRSWISSHYHVRIPRWAYSFKSPQQLIRKVAKPVEKFSEFARLARILVGSSIGLVLGGGGARTSLWDKVYDLTYPASATFTGALWRYVRGSMSLAGYLPPICCEEDGHLLLDGGYVNNLPANVVRNMGVSKVFAIDVGSQDDTNLLNYGDALSGWWVLWNKWMSRSQSLKVLDMAEIQSRLAYVSSYSVLEVVKKSSYCFYIRPPIEKYNTLDFGLFHEICVYQQANTFTDLAALVSIVKYKRSDEETKSEVDNDVAVNLAVAESQPGSINRNGKTQGGVEFFARRSQLCVEYCVLESGSNTKLWISDCYFIQPQYMQDSADSYKTASVELHKGVEFVFVCYVDNQVGTFYRNHSYMTKYHPWENMINWLNVNDRGVCSIIVFENRTNLIGRIEKLLNACLSPPENKTVAAAPSMFEWIAIGAGVFLVIVLILLIFFLYVKRRKQRKTVANKESLRNSPSVAATKSVSPLQRKSTFKSVVRKSLESKSDAESTTKNVSKRDKLIDEVTRQKLSKYSDKTKS